MDDRYYAGIDLGGTHIAVGIVNEKGRLISKASAATLREKSAGMNIKIMRELFEQQLAEQKIPYDAVCSIGLGVPGTANLITGEIEDINNLTQFQNVPIVRMLAEEFPNKKICFDNDANAAAWGEYLAGAGKGAESLIAVTIGTGIGGGIILNHELYRGVNYASGEFGHMVIAVDGTACSCGRFGCFEAYASAEALVKQIRQAMQEDPDSCLWKLCEYHLDRINGKSLFDAMSIGDGTAKAVFGRYLNYLTAGIVNLVNLFQPQVLCIGGGISEAGEVLLDPLQKAIEKERYSGTSGRQTKLVSAQLGNQAGIIGAALLGKQAK